MITEEERQSIINEAVEKALLMLPEVVGNLITSQVSLLKLNRTFYEQHPEFANSKDVVAAVVEKLDGSNPGIDYKKLLEMAVPMVKSQLGTMKSLDMKSIPKPNRNLASLDIGLKSDHGEL